MTVVWLGKDYGTTGCGTRIYPYSLYWLSGGPFSLDGYLAQPRYSIVLTFSEEWMGGSGRELEGIGGGKGMGTRFDM